MISANFIHNTLTKPVEARAMPPKERREIIRHKDGAVTPESLKSLEPEFRLVREYVKERRPHISRSAGKGIFFRGTPEPVWQALDILCRSVPPSCLTQQVGLELSAIVTAYKVRGGPRPVCLFKDFVPDCSWVRTDEDVIRYIKELRSLPGGKAKRFPGKIRAHITRAAHRAPPYLVAERYGVSSWYVLELLKKEKEIISDKKI